MIQWAGDSSLPWGKSTLFSDWLVFARPLVHHGCLQIADNYYIGRANGLGSRCNSVKIWCLPKMLTTYWQTNYIHASSFLIPIHLSFSSSKELRIAFPFTWNVRSRISFETDVASTMQYSLFSRNKDFGRFVHYSMTLVVFRATIINISIPGEEEYLVRMKCLWKWQLPLEDSSGLRERSDHTLGTFSKVIAELYWIFLNDWKLEKRE